jgi:riboflavin synthase
MFTGLIESTGLIQEIKESSSGKEFVIYCPELAPQIKVDDSVAINGVCLTAVHVTSDSFLATAVHLTLEKTNLKYLKPQERVNLELALKFSDRLGGHLVQGHVGGVATLNAIEKRGDNYEIKLSLPSDQMKYIINEGSIALDGISLTVAHVKDNEILITIIPHTWTKTQLHTRKVGDQINFEVDMMAKYLENFYRYQLKAGQNVSV